MIVKYRGVTVAPAASKRIIPYSIHNDIDQGDLTWIIVGKENNITSPEWIPELESVAELNCWSLWQNWS